MHILFVYKTNSRGEFFIFENEQQLLSFKRLYENLGKNTEMKVL